MDLLTKKIKNDMLDPLSVIIKLYIYNYTQKNSKISISNNKLDIQISGYFQGVVRAYNRDNKNDIPILTMPILYACNTYLINDKSKYELLFQRASETFLKLKETYQGNEIMFNIDTLNGYIQSFINDDSSVNTINIAGSYNSDGGKIKQNIYSNISNVWNEKRINTIFDFINEIELCDNNSTERQLLINSISEYMAYIDLLVYNKITNL